MKHFDQDIIELYVLGSKKIEQSKEDLERHLVECYTCREIARELTEFYRAVGASKPLLAPGNEMREDALTLNPEYRTVMTSRVALPSRMWAGLRAHPLASSLTSIGMLGLVLLMLRAGGSNVPLQDTNPDHVQISESLGALVAYNASDEIVWQIPQASAATLNMDEAMRHFRFSVVTDLNGDGQNEVVTTLPIADEGSIRCLRVFDFKKEIKLQPDLKASEVTYRGMPYDAGFEPIVPFVLSPPARKTKEILVSATNGRSPMFVARFDNHGNIMGRMWHYGTLGSQYLVDLHGDGTMSMILCGVSDVDEKTTGPGSVIVVIDPMKLIGETESSATRGFGKGVSNSEIYYILLPQTDISAAQKSILCVRTLERTNENVLRFSAFGTEQGDSEQFEFIFSRDFRILEVKSSTLSDRIRTILANEGKISRVPDDKYVEDLKSRVRYWNGQRWVKEHTAVDHSLAASLPR
jgi:hypothetical protein